MDGLILQPYEKLSFAIPLVPPPKIARRHGPEGTRRDHARVPFGLFPRPHHHRLARKRHRRPASLTRHQLRLAHQQRELYSQVLLGLSDTMDGWVLDLPNITLGSYYPTLTRSKIYPPKTEFPISLY